jgi:hypothetical protein
LNAIGVKADSSGFATPGGTEPVTHFGMFDNTADFFGGASAGDPPNITSPGEFDLKTPPV